MCSIPSGLDIEGIFFMYLHNNSTIQGSILAIGITKCLRLLNSFVIFGIRYKWIIINAFSALGKISNS